LRAGRIFWKLFIGHAALVSLVLGACLWLVVARFDRIHDQEHTAELRRWVWTIGFIALVGAFALAFGLAVLWSGRIFRLTATAHRLARGDLSAPIDAVGNDEVSLLARSLERMRDRLRRQLVAMEHQSRSLESLLAQLHEGVVVSDPNGRIVLLNPAASRFLGVSWHGDLDRAATAGGRVEDHVRNPDLRAMLLPEATPAGGDDEKRLEIHGDHGVLSILARASEIALPPPGAEASMGEPSGQSVTGRLLVLTDITELSRAMQVRSEFVANASHELRTPISAIRAAVDTVLKIDVAREAEHATRFLGVITRHTSRLEALVGDLLDLSRLENPTATFQPEVLRLQRLCDDLHDRWLSDIDAKKLRWRCDITDDCPNVFANPYLLNLVLDNLVDNAIKFTDPCGNVGVGCRCGEAAIEIEVFDTGCGIAAHEHQRVFERFYQVESPGSPVRPRGTGLGLSIVRHAIAAMGGSVLLDSAPGRGTRVTVRIPNQQPAVTQP